MHYMYSLVLAKPLLLPSLLLSLIFYQNKIAGLHEVFSPNTKQWLVFQIFCQLSHLAVLANKFLTARRLACVVPRQESTVNLLSVLQTAWKLNNTYIVLISVCNKIFCIASYKRRRDLHSIQSSTSCKQNSTKLDSDFWLWTSPLWRSVT